MLIVAAGCLFVVASSNNTAGNDCCLIATFGWKAFILHRHSGPVYNGIENV